jgi:hypothetical protein
MTQRSPEPDERQKLLALFTEVNENMRATESKHLQVAIGYMGLLSLALAIMALPNQETSATVVEATWPKAIAYGVLSAVGCMTVYVLDAYRGWKQHYRLVAIAISRRLGLETIHGPFWLKHGLYFPLFKRRAIGRWLTFGALSPDNCLTYFATGVTCLTTAIFNYLLWTLIESPASRIAIVAVSATGFLSFVAYSRRRAIERKKRINDECGKLGLELP